MKNMLNLLWQKKFLILVLALLIALLPIAMTKEPVVLSRALLTSIGIEKDGDTYTIHAEHFIFNFDPFGVMEREIVSGEGKSVQEALTNLGTRLGKSTSLTHCTIIILGKGLESHNMLELLRPLLLKPQLDNDCMLFYTQSDIEPLMQTSIETGDARSGRIHVIAQFNQRQQMHSSVTLEKFFRQSLAGNQTVRMPRVNLQDDQIENDGTYATFLGGKLLHVPE